MNVKILLIVPPQTEIGGRICSPLLSEQLDGLDELATMWQNAGCFVDFLDAETARLNLFEIVRETRRRAVHYVWIRNTDTVATQTLTLLLINMLRLALPSVTVIYKNRVFSQYIDQSGTFSTTMSLIKSASQSTYHGKTSASGYPTSSPSHHTNWHRSQNDFC